MYQQEIHYITPAVTPLCPDGQIDFAVKYSLSYKITLG